VSEPIRYTVRFPDAKNHYAEITASIPVTGPVVELFMAVWTPGSYLIREHAQHVEGFTAAGCEWEKSRKNRWRIATSAARIEVGYRVYGRTMGVQSNWIESGFALLNGAATFLSLVETAPRPHEVVLELPAEWQGAYTGLDALGPCHFGARDYDTLVDCPIYAGSPRVYEFEAAARTHYLINEGEAGVWNGEESVQAVERIVREYHRMMGVIPYDRYLFINLLLESGGGLEHQNSTVLMASRWAWRNNEEAAPDAPPPRKPNRTNWLDLVSHEFFHLWNVKRLRPVEFGPFDYETENYSRTLWVAEGMTTYYGPLAVKRARLIDPGTYLKLLSREITQLQTTPGRLTQPVETSSYDAWIKLYRQNENSTNTLISYYTKGAVIAWLIDVRLQRHGRSLDDVMRVAYARYSQTRGYTSQQFRDLISEVAGEDLGEWLRPMLETTAELDYAEALDWFGLRFAESSPQKPYLGITTKSDGGRIVVTVIPRGTPAYGSGLNVDDEIVAINGFRVRGDGLATALGHYSAGETIEILAARRERLVTFAVQLATEPRRVWQLEADPQATLEQRTRLANWLRDTLPG
jgi:predicted metalloprotease with PDZ domain